jgi:hypothetical protein
LATAKIEARETMTVVHFISILQRIMFADS